jgi:hypothetical protein
VGEATLSGNGTRDIGRARIDGPDIGHIPLGRLVVSGGRAAILTKAPRQPEERVAFRTDGARFIWEPGARAHRVEFDDGASWTFRVKSGGCGSCGGDDRLTVEEALAE